MTADPLIYLWGSATCWLEIQVSADQETHEEGEEYLNYLLAQDEIKQSYNERISEVYNLKALLTINALMPLSISEWLGTDAFSRQFGLPTAVKDALLYEVDKVLQERARAQRKLEQDIKLQREADKPTGVSLPHNMGGISGYFK